MNYDAFTAALQGECATRKRPHIVVVAFGALSLCACAPNDSPGHQGAQAVGLKGTQNGTNSNQATDVGKQAEEIAGTMRAGEVVGGDPAAIDRFCAARVAPVDRAATYEQAENLYRQAQSLVEQFRGEENVSTDLLTRALSAACSGRFGFGQKDDLWAWNEYHIGQALLFFGHAQDHPSALKLAIIASLNAAEVFVPTDEGWGWSRHTAGQAAHVLSQVREDPELYRAKALELLLQVIANPDMPPEQRAYARLELANRTLGHRLD